MATKTPRHPKWWSNDYDSAWERVKAAFKRDWQQTKHDFGGKEPDLKQSVDDTVEQAFGQKPIPPKGVPNFDEHEPAYRFGYGARRHYENTTSAWSFDIERKLEEEWGDDWDKYRDSVRRGWEYQG